MLIWGMMVVALSAFLSAEVMQSAKDSNSVSVTPRIESGVSEFEQQILGQAESFSNYRADGSLNPLVASAIASLTFSSNLDVDATHLDGSNAFSVVTPDNNSWQLCGSSCVPTTCDPKATPFICKDGSGQQYFEAVIQYNSRRNIASVGPKYRAVQVQVPTGATPLSCTSPSAPFLHVKANNSLDCQTGQVNCPPGAYLNGVDDNNLQPVCQAIGPTTIAATPIGTSFLKQFTWSGGSAFTTTSTAQISPFTYSSFASSSASQTPDPTPFPYPNQYAPYVGEHDRYPLTIVYDSSCAGATAVNPPNNTSYMLSWNDPITQVVSVNNVSMSQIKRTGGTPITCPEATFSGPVDCSGGGGAPGNMPNYAVTYTVSCSIQVTVAFDPNTCPAVGSGTPVFNGTITGLNSPPNYTAGPLNPPINISTDPYFVSGITYTTNNGNSGTFLSGGTSTAYTIGGPNPFSLSASTNFLVSCANSCSTVTPTAAIAPTDLLMTYCEVLDSSGNPVLVNGQPQWGVSGCTMINGPNYPVKFSLQVGTPTSVCPVNNKAILAVQDSGTGDFDTLLAMLLPVNPGPTPDPQTGAIDATGAGVLKYPNASFSGTLDPGYYRFRLKQVNPEAGITDSDQFYFTVPTPAPSPCPNCTGLNGTVNVPICYAFGTAVNGGFPNSTRSGGSSYSPLTIVMTANANPGDSCAIQTSGDGSYEGVPLNSNPLEPGFCIDNVGFKSTPSPAVYPVGPGSSSTTYMYSTHTDWSCQTGDAGGVQLLCPQDTIQTCVGANSTISCSCSRPTVNGVMPVPKSPTNYCFNSTSSSGKINFSSTPYAYYPANSTGPIQYYAARYMDNGNCHIAVGIFDANTGIWLCTMGKHNYGDGWDDESGDLPTVCSDEQVGGPNAGYEHPLKDLENQGCDPIPGTSGFPAPTTGLCP